MAFCMLLKLFMFLISTRVPYTWLPRGMTLTLTSTLSGVAAVGAVGSVRGGWGG